MRTKSGYGNEMGMESSECKGSRFTSFSHTSNHTWFDNGGWSMGRSPDMY